VDAGVVYAKALSGGQGLTGNLEQDAFVSGSVHAFHKKTDDSVYQD
jgi:hypothetical protein